MQTLLKRCGLEDARPLQRLSEEERQRLNLLVTEESYVLRPMLLVLLIWCISTYFSLSTSGVFYPVTTCSTAWWAYTLTQFPILAIVTAVVTWICVKRYTEKRFLHWVPDSGDIEWNFAKAIIYPLFAMLAGGLGGLLGIGGGMIISPLLLELGVVPRVTSATSAIAVAVTSSSGTLQKLLLGLIHWDYLIYYMTVGALGSFVGQTLLDWALKRYKRQSIVVFLVQIVMILAVCLMGLKGILDIIQGNSSFRFGSIC